jgi:palmitoyltransferase ZDHHC13/17
MHWAAMQGSLEVLEFLLSQGASPDAHDPDPASGLVAYPLHWAAINARLMFCKVFLDNGAAVDPRGGDLNATPMMWAAKYNLAALFLGAVRG